MVILEVLSGKSPFAGYNTLIVMQKVIRGEHPERPEGAWFENVLWETLEQCWSPQPKFRPTIEAVLECLERVSVPRLSPLGVVYNSVPMYKHKSEKAFTCALLLFTSDLPLKKTP
jgi:hypothetical protein